MYKIVGNSTECYQLTNFSGGYACGIVTLYGCTNTGNMYISAIVFVGKQQSITTSNTQIRVIDGSKNSFDSLVEIYTDGNDVFGYPKMQSGGGTVFVQLSFNFIPSIVTKDKSSLTRIVCP